VIELAARAAASLSRWIRPAIDAIALGMVATILVIYGAPIGRLIKRGIRHFHFIIRLSILVLICSAGYTTFMVFSADMIAGALYGLDDLALGPVVVGLFIGLGVLAERKRYM
jgi:glucose uptake protein GlcU